VLALCDFALARSLGVEPSAGCPQNLILDTGSLILRDTPLLVVRKTDPPRFNMPRQAGSPARKVHGVVGVFKVAGRGRMIEPYLYLFYLELLYADRADTKMLLV